MIPKVSHRQVVVFGIRRSNEGAAMNRPEKKRSPSTEARLQRLGWGKVEPAEPPIPQPPSKTTSLVAEIESWERDYSLGARRARGSRGDWFHQEFRHLKFRGNLIRPSRFKLRKIELTLIPDRSDGVGSVSSDSVGHLGRSRSQWEPLIAIPASALTPILTVADRFKFILLGVTGHVAQGADIRSFNLRTSVDEEELQNQD